MVIDWCFLLSCLVDHQTMQNIIIIYCQWNQKMYCKKLEKLKSTSQFIYDIQNRMNWEINQNRTTHKHVRKFQNTKANTKWPILNCLASFKKNTTLKNKNRWSQDLFSFCFQFDDPCVTDPLNRGHLSHYPTFTNCMYFL